MKTLLNLPFYLLFICFASSFSSTPSAIMAAPPGVQERERVATDIVSNLAKKDYAAVRKDFTKITLDGLSEEKIREVWEGLMVKIGDFKSVLSTKEEEIHGYRVVKKRCQFASDNQTIQVTFNEENKVIGLYIRP